jgi:hypothetical protein
MEINEIKKARINGHEVLFPINYWLNINNGLIEKKINIEIENFNFQIQIGNEKSITQICNQNDLFILLKRLNITIVDFEDLRLKVIKTNKWGDKLIYNDGAKSLCFNCYSLNNENRCYIILFNTDGTKEVENIYIHGIWTSLSSAKSK